MINTVTLIGRLARDPELKRSPKGNSCSEFTLAVNNYRNKEAQAMYFDCTAWNEKAEAIAKNCRKGSWLAIAGELYQVYYESRSTGEKRSKIKIIVRDFQFYSAPKLKRVELVDETPEGCQPNEEPTAYADQIVVNGEAKAVVKDIVDDDLPF